MRSEKLGRHLALSRLFAGMAFQLLVIHGFYRLYTATGSPLQVGLFGFALYLPSLLLTFASGRAIDGTTRIGQGFVLLQTAIFAGSLLFFIGDQKTTSLYIGSFLFACLRTIRAPFYYSLLSHLKTNGLNSARAVRQMALSWQIPLIVSPLLFSLLTSRWPELDLTWVIAAFSALSLVFSLPLYGVLRSSPTAHSNASWLMTIRNFCAHRELSAPLLADAAVMSLLAFTSVLPFLLTDIGAKAEDLGLYRAMLNAGSLCASALIPREAFHSSRPRMFGLVLILTSLLVASASATASGPMLLLLCGTIGLFDGWSVLYRDHLLLELVAPHEMGRVSSINQILISTTDDFGEIRAGLFAEVLSPRTGMLVSAGLATVLSLTFTWRTLSRNKRSAITSSNARPSDTSGYLLE